LILTQIGTTARVDVVDDGLQVFVIALPVGKKNIERIVERFFFYNQ